MNFLFACSCHWPFSSLPVVHEIEFPSFDCGSERWRSSRFRWLRAKRRGSKRDSVVARMTVLHIKADRLLKVTPHVTDPCPTPNSLIGAIQELALASCVSAGEAIDGYMISRRWDLTDWRSPGQQVSRCWRVS